MTAELAREIVFRSGEHLVLVTSSVALALLIALPLGLAIQAHPRWRRLVLGLANAVQTIPSLAIFGLLLTVPLLGGIGSTPAVVALTLYALLPLLRGLLTGLQQVPPGLKQAGQALGLSGGQVLRYVELPLALPSLMAGLRVAAVIAVGVATIGAAIGAGGLGVFIFRGIATVNNTLLLAGALPAAAIALAADACLGALENHLVQGTGQPLQRSRLWLGIREWLRRRWALAAALTGAALLAVVLGWHQLAPPGPAGSVVIGAKGFTEQQLLGELLAQEIEELTSLQVRREFSLGSTFLCHEAVRQGRVDGYVEYTGTAWSAILKQPSGPGASDRASLWSRARRLYAERYGLRMFPSLGFENTFAILIRQAQGQQRGLRTISQAVQPARRWRAAFGYEFLNRGDGYPGLASRYGLRFAAPPTAMDLGLTYRALADGRVDLIAGDSTSGLIPSLKLQVLLDDRHYFPAYDAVPVFNAASLERHPELVPVLENLAGRLSAATMQQLNAAVDLDHQSPELVVRRWRQDH
ncbi:MULTISPECIES: glycine betaine ABC transporter substrate-binding protein [unclassified Cyanobium]|uniref:glycine betaine ABC transporter substrate-binding protein n=1 Tax=unclassified Cyanobium TaxID=2627006 RepID=UPI0020CB9C90|nr:MULTISPECIES: glycine betaine ABC transporter substrate-binding protein [unclassified Cyanobium]MCP9778723.1 ABC transporter permease subunit [Cyanobium sp. Tous-M-B4]MCP9877036.1 ABC transporter permease subunit [Cyanobium sp. A2C-AMD]